MPIQHEPTIRRGRGRRPRPRPEAAAAPAAAVTPFSHQTEAIRRLGSRPRYCLWHDCGLGKTYSVLKAIEADPVRTIVVCPKSIMWCAWAEDAARFVHELPVAILDPGGSSGSKPIQRRKLIEDPAWTVLVMNYERFVAHSADLAAKSVGVRRLVVDEASALKTHNTARTKAAIAFSDRVASCWLLSGTPAPNGPWEYWAQLRATLRPVPYVIESFWRFVGRFFVERREWHNGIEHNAGFELREDREREFTELLAGIGWRLSKEQALDLPERLDVFREFDLGPDERRSYEELSETLRAEFEGGQAIDATAASLIGKLRQICGGACYGWSSRTEGPAGAADFGRSKLDAARELLVELGPRPVVIWCEFRHEIARLVPMIEGMGRRVGVLAGEGADPRGKRIDPAQSVDHFQRGILDVLVAVPAAVAHGITLTRASDAIYFTPGWSWELHSQSRDRIHRIGQRRNCTYYYLVARDTCERQVIGSLAAKRTQDEILKSVIAGLGGQ